MPGEAPPPLPPPATFRRSEKLGGIMLAPLATFLAGLNDPSHLIKLAGILERYRTPTSYHRYDFRIVDSSELPPAASPAEDNEELWRLWRRERGSPVILDDEPRERGSEGVGTKGKEGKEKDPGAINVDGSGTVATVSYGPYGQEGVSCHTQINAGALETTRQSTALREGGAPSDTQNGLRGSSHPVASANGEGEQSFAPSPGAPILTATSAMEQDTNGNEGAPVPSEGTALLVQSDGAAIADGTPQALTPPDPSVPPGQPSSVADETPSPSASHIEMTVTETRFVLVREAALVSSAAGASPSAAANEETANGPETTPHAQPTAAEPATSTEVSEPAQGTSSVTQTSWEVAAASVSMSLANGEDVAGIDVHGLVEVDGSRVTATTATGENGLRHEEGTGDVPMADESSAEGVTAADATFSADVAQAEVVAETEGAAETTERVVENAEGSAETTQEAADNTPDAEAFVAGTAAVPSAPRSPSPFTPAFPPPPGGTARCNRELRLDLRTLDVAALFQLEVWRREVLGLEPLDMLVPASKWYHVETPPSQPKKKGRPRKTQTATGEGTAAEPIVVDSDATSRAGAPAIDLTTPADTPDAPPGAMLDGLPVFGPEPRPTTPPPRTPTPDIILPDGFDDDTAADPDFQPPPSLFKTRGRPRGRGRGRGRPRGRGRGGMGLDGRHMPDENGMDAAATDPSADVNMATAAPAGPSTDTSDAIALRTDKSNASVGATDTTTAIEVGADISTAIEVEPSPPITGTIELNASEHDDKTNDTLPASGVIEVAQPQSATSHDYNAPHDISTDSVDVMATDAVMREAGHGTSVERDDAPAVELLDSGGNDSPRQASTRRAPRSRQAASSEVSETASVVVLGEPMVVADLTDTSADAIGPASMSLEARSALPPTPPPPVAAAAGSSSSAGGVSAALADPPVRGTFARRAVWRKSTGGVGARGGPKGVANNKVSVSGDASDDSDKVGTIAALRRRRSRHAVVANEDVHVQVPAFVPCEPRQYLDCIEIITTRPLAIVPKSEVVTPRAKSEAVTPKWSPAAAVSTPRQTRSKVGTPSALSQSQSQAPKQPTSVTPRTSTPSTRPKRSPPTRTPLSTPPIRTQRSPATIRTQRGTKRPRAEFESEAELAEAEKKPKRATRARARPPPAVNDDDDEEWGCLIGL